MTTGPVRMRGLTLNTWFGEYQFDLRMRAQLALFEKLQPDIIALQEVTSEGLLGLEKSDWIRDNYTLPDDASGLISAAGYGVCMLVRGQTSSFEYHPLPVRLAAVVAMVVAMGVGLVWLVW